MSCFSETKGGFGNPLKLVIGVKIEDSLGDCVL